MEILEQKKLSLFKKYYLEASVIFLACILGIVVNFVVNLNDKFLNYILEDKQKSAIQVEKSTEALNNNTEILQEIKAVIKNSK